MTKETQELADFIADEVDRIQPSFEVLAEKIIEAGWKKVVPEQKLRIVKMETILKILDKMTNYPLHISNKDIAKAIHKRIYK
jgi:hypothetical protein